MSIIQFKEANCKNCYKCIRCCPVKAIEFVHEQAQIIEEDCLLCGNCLSSCPQNAKYVKSDVERIKEFIKKKEKVYVSLAPSFVAAFDEINEEQLFGALKVLGFTHVEETAIGATVVSKKYEELLEDRKMKNIISSACPSIVYLVEKYYPELLNQLAPIVSPMIAHAKMMRALYGPRIKVVFIGPCLSKKGECKDAQNQGAVDAVITFEELSKWLEEEKSDSLYNYVEKPKSPENITARIYPAPGGIIKTLGLQQRKNYKCISVVGVDNCISILDSIKNGGIENYFIEMNSCVGSCLSGPCIPHKKGGFLEARERVLAYLKKGIRVTPTLISDAKLDLSKKFVDCSRKLDIPEESIIQGILDSIGKFTVDQELNCGACGYATCRDKAIAVHNKRAQLFMCLPYMRERAESLTNLIVNTTPNALFALDEKLCIQEINIAALKLFDLNHEDMKGKSIYEVLNCSDMELVLENGQDIIDEKFYYEKYDITVKQSILLVPEQNILVVVIKDISEEEKSKELDLKVRSERAEIAQKVIDKQMRVAQEIASLLGETTAETKVALTKLKKSILKEMSEAE